MAVLIIFRTTSASTYISSTQHCTSGVFYLLGVSFLGLFFHLAVPSFPSSHFSLLSGRLLSPSHLYVSLHQMADMDDAMMILIPATPVFGEASAQGIRETVRREVEFLRTMECVVCRNQEVDSNVMTASCGELYCGGCVNELFDRAAKHEFNFPPKCCGQIITLANAESFLSSDIYDKFQKKSEEYSTTNRTYCSDPECVTFISPKAVDDGQAKCPACQRLTCIVCKEEVHEGGCLEDPAAQSLMTAAAEAGFQQCQECKRMIERINGCDHITCTCGAEFCYVCGAKWRTCNCRDEGDPLDEAEGFLQYAVDHVLHIHEDNRIDWRIPAAAGA
ncbi:hypothetical protein HO173_012036 [Letharia columbiana]|uniref:RBR-type E3 ubiquitin transferase n=1 Tax=Letharia columbiana TaxID=112416 RepID=A0A8H6FGX2_9LECA|nr:uncharacterized protein HO173_012036 [Letharia columbiana]KAF6227706.1 hypothetical protein HO173_012036 [Letharia columbiana]